MEAGEVITAIFFMLIVAGTIISIVSVRANAGGGVSIQSNSSGDAKQLADTIARIEAKLDNRLDAIEARMSNLETIVLDQEKHKEFDRAL